MRITEKRRTTVPGKRRRAGLKTGKRGKELANPFHKLRGVGAQRVDVDRYLDAVGGKFRLRSLSFRRALLPRRPLQTWGD